MNIRPQLGRARGLILCLVVLAIPIVLFLLPLISKGVVILDDDNLIQNYPLRVFVGQLIASGHLPLWDPYIWSGTPLLGGFNAGAANPLTLLFAVLPPATAWAMTEFLAYAVAALGMFLFLRLLGLSPLSAAIGAVTFSFSGFMSSQLAHIGDVQGASLLPWSLWALTKLSREHEARKRVLWATILGLLYGMIILAGSPEPMAYGGLLITVYGIWLLFHNRATLIPTLAYGFFAIGIAAVVGAPQLISGAQFLALSQRAHIGFTFFSSYSLRPSLLILQLLPFILGGYGHVIPFQYLGPLNLAELNGYPGFVSWMAIFGLTPALFVTKHRPIRIWYLIAGLGLLLALGGYTPLGIVVAHIPVLDGLRTQSRNLLEFDFAASVLCGYWVDSIQQLTTLNRILSCIPWLITCVILVVFVLGSPFKDLAGYETYRPIVIRYLVFICSLGALLSILTFGGHVVGSRATVLCISMLIAVDLGVFNSAQYWNQPSSYMTVSRLNDNMATRFTNYMEKLGATGRIAVYDPFLNDGLITFDQPDLNVLQRIPSAQGYGSLVDGRYFDATGAHGLLNLYPQVLDTRTVNQLNLAWLVSLPMYFAQPISAHGSPSLVPTIPSPTVTLPAGSQRGWFFGTSGHLATVSIYTPTPARAAAGIRVGIEQFTSRRIDWLPVSAAADVIGDQVRYPVPRSFGSSTMVLVKNTGNAPITITFVTITYNTGSRFLLQGWLHNYVTYPHWQVTTISHRFVVLNNKRARGWFWVQGGTRTASTVRFVYSTQSATTATFVIHGTHTLRLIRSVTYTPGWIAYVNGSPAPIHAYGLVQSLVVPPGTHRVVFRYRSAATRYAMLLSILTLLAGTLISLRIIASQHHKATSRPR